MKVTTKGQVTIPREIRQRLGIVPHSEVDFEVVGNTVRLRKARGGGRGKRLITRLRGRGDVRMSTEEILALTRS